LNNAKGLIIIRAWAYLANANTGVKMNKKLIITMMASLYLVGCASGAVMESMIYKGDQKTYDAKLKNQLNVAPATGGKKTNPAWSSQISNEAFEGAVKESLKKQGLFSEAGQYKLQVKMIKLEQPVFGLDMTVTSYVQYTLTDTSTNTTVLDETVIAAHTATFDDAFAGVKRLRLANEGSGMKNIEGLLNKLAGLKLGAEQVSLAE
jgi:hypothetical protein